VLAIGSLYEHSHVSPYSIELVGVQPVIDSHHDQALGWYNRAIARFIVCIQHYPHDSSLALLSCLLFICIGLQQDNISNVLALLRQGFRLLSSTADTAKRANSNSTIRDIVTPVFARHAVLASTLGTSDSFRRLDNRSLQFKLAFSTLQDARAVLYELMEHGHAFIRMSGMRIKDQDTIADLIPLRDTLLSKLAEWLSIFTRLDCKATTLEICASSNLLMYHGVALIWLSTHLSSVQTAFDNDNSRFENIVHHADIILAHNNTQPSFTFEMGGHPTSLLRRNQMPTPNNPPYGPVTTQESAPQRALVEGGTHGKSRGEDHRVGGREQWSLVEFPPREAGPRRRREQEDPTSRALTGGQARR